MPLTTRVTAYYIRYVQLDAQYTHTASTKNKTVSKLAGRGGVADHARVRGAPGDAGAHLDVQRKVVAANDCRCTCVWMCVRVCVCVWKRVLSLIGIGLVPSEMLKATVGDCVGNDELLVSGTLKLGQHRSWDEPDVRLRPSACGTLSRLAQQSGGPLLAQADG